MFGDSSLDVFCCVAFLRAQKNTYSKCQLAFVFGKARVAPMKMLSIPKLELQAALLASRLKDDIEKALTLSTSKVFMWTGSTTVLQWLNSTSKQPVFVANGVAEVLESTSIDQWFHVPIILDSRHCPIRLFLRFITLSTNISPSTTFVSSFISKLMYYA